MARIAIVVMIPVMALLGWRDWVLERQIRLLAMYDAVQYDHVGDKQIVARDERIDDAMWDLLLGYPTAARMTIDEVTRMPAPTPVPQRAWHVAQAADCSLGNQRAWPSKYITPNTRVSQFCAKK